MINLTLNKLKRPALLNLVPKFGTVVEKNDINKGGLSTAEVDLNMTLPFELMRETEVSSSDTTTPIHYDARIAIVGSDTVTLTLDHATYKGCTITITNRNTEQATIVLSEDNEKHLESKQSLVLKWDGTAWIDTALVVDSTVSEESHNPVTSAAVYQKATEITEAYTQAIADETDSRGEAIAEEQRLREEAITATEQKIEEETTARTEADTALGTRIDEEVAARTEADTKLTQQIEAIEQLHNALVSNAEGFVDSDGDTVTVEDSGKTIRQIAHEEFYRQLITDAADVQTQIDTLKELADYLQTNPSVIADMYSKLGITWSVDNLTDFGAFDFSGVLTATNVDDAILELYNTFTEKFGELNTKIGEEVTARTEADTALGARIDEELSGVAGEVNSLKESVSELGTEVEALKSTVPGEPIDAYTKTEVDGKFDNVYTKTEVDDKFSEQSGGNSATNCEQFTFVVDSNEALAAWANATEGNDYTSVLIRKGEWTLNTFTQFDSRTYVGINLTRTKTKVIVGESGSKLIFIAESNLIEFSYRGIMYEEIPNETLYNIKNLDVEFYFKNIGRFAGFYRCINIFDSTIKIRCENNNNKGMMQGYAVWYCNKIYRCTVIVTDIIGEYVQEVFPFLLCDYIEYCTAKSIEFPCFSLCKNIKNSTGESDSFVYSKCDGLDNCTGYADWLVSECKRVRYCKASKHCRSGVFEIFCYASSEANDKYIPADTPEGGFNDTTNPPAE